MPDLSHSQSGYIAHIHRNVGPDGLVWLQSLCFHKKCQMPEIELIADQLKRAFDGEASHGPALIEILRTALARLKLPPRIPSVMRTVFGSWSCTSLLGNG